MTLPLLAVAVAGTLVTGQTMKVGEALAVHTLQATALTTIITAAVVELLMVTIEGRVGVKED